MTCTNCGYQNIKENAVFCPNCGAKLVATPNISVAMPEQEADNTAELKIPLGNHFQSPLPKTVLECKKMAGSIPIQNNLKKSRLNIKVLIPIMVVFVLLIGILLLVVAFLPSKDMRAIKKAWESKDINQVMKVYSPTSADSRETLYAYIEEATNELNNDFTYEIKEEKDVWAALKDFIKTRWGTLFISRDDFDSKLYEIAYLMPVLENFEKMAYSKKTYYEALWKLEHTENANEYLSAIQSLLAVIPTDKNHFEVSAKVSEAATAYIDKIMEIANTYMAKNDYNGALGLFEEAVDALDFEGAEDYSGNIAAKVAEAKIAYAAQYAQKAEECFQAGDIKAAVGNIEAAVKVTPNGSYEAKLKEYQLYLPLALYDEDNVLKKEGKFISKESETANDNSEHCNIMRFFHDNDYRVEKFCVLTYNLAGKYNKVSGTIYVPKSSKDDVQKGYFEAYGDGELLYTSPTMTAGVLPSAIEFDVSGVQTLEIHTYGQSATFWGSEFSVSELTARKTALA